MRINIPLPYPLDRLSSQYPTAILLFLILSLGIAGYGFSNIFDRSETSSTTSSIQDLQSRMADLETEVDALRSAALPPLEPSKAIGSPVTEEQSDLERRLDALEALVAHSGVTAEGVPDEIVSAEEMERTRQALAEVRREEMGTRITSWIDQERAKSEQLLTAVEEKMNLPWREQQRVREIMTTEADQHAQILEEMWSVEPPTNRAEQEAMAADWDRATIGMKEIRLKRDEELQELLGKERFAELLDVVRAASRPAGEQRNP